MFFHSAFFACLLICSLSWAQESSEQTQISQEYSGKQNQDWEKIQTRLGNLKARLDTQEGIVANLLHEKAGLTGEAQIKKIEELKAEYQTYEKIAAEYNKVNDEYHTKFPERGIKASRVYNRVKIGTLESFEEDHSIQKKVSKLHNKILRQYPTATKAAKKPGKNSIKNQDETPVESSGDSVTDPIIFKK